VRLFEHNTCLSQIVEKAANVSPFFLRMSKLQSLLDVFRAGTRCHGYVLYLVQVRADSCRAEFCLVYTAEFQGGDLLVSGYLQRFGPSRGEVELPY